MKNSIALLALFKIVLVLSIIFAITTKQNLKSNSNQTISAQKIKKIVMPFYQQAFIPIEVDKVDEVKRRITSPTMSRVETIGEQTDDSSGFHEKPVIYTTIISSKPTNISTSGQRKENSYQPKISPVNRMLEETPVKKEELQPGQYSIPVELSGSTVINAPNQLNYDNPQIISKKKSKKEKKDEIKISEKKSAILHKSKLQEVYSKIGEEDLSMIRQSLESASTIDQKVENLLVARKQIKNETKDLLVNLRENINNIVDTNSVNKRLMDILSKYERTKINDDSNNNEADEVKTLLNELDSSLNSKLDKTKAKK